MKKLIVVLIIAALGYFALKKLGVIRPEPEPGARPVQSQDAGSSKSGVDTFLEHSTGYSAAAKAKQYSADKIKRISSGQGDD